VLGVFYFLGKVIVFLFSISGCAELCRAFVRSVDELRLEIFSTGRIINIVVTATIECQACLIWSVVSESFDGLVGDRPFW